MASTPREPPPMAACSMVEQRLVRKWNPKTWPRGVDAMVLPGYPALGSIAYPPATTTLERALARKGVVLRRSHEVDAWVAFKTEVDLIFAPVLLFASQALANGAGTLLAEFIKHLVTRRRAHNERQRPKVRTFLALEVGERTSARDVWFRSSGDPDDVLMAFQKWNSKRAKPSLNLPAASAPLPVRTRTTRRRHGRT